MTIEQVRHAAVPLCRQLNVKRLDLFGSLARGDDNPESDVDLLVEFAPSEAQLHKRFFGLLHQLEDALGRRVDLLTDRGLRNPYLRRRVLQERVTIYEG